MGALKHLANYTVKQAKKAFPALPKPSIQKMKHPSIGHAAKKLIMHKRAIPSIPRSVGFPRSKFPPSSTPVVNSPIGNSISYAGRAALKIRK